MTYTSLELANKAVTATTAKTFGAKVEDYRERLDIQQKELAERSGLSAPHLNRIVKGTRKRPRVKTVRRMIEVLRLTRAEAEELVDLAGLSPLVLENLKFEEEQGKATGGREKMSQDEAGSSRGQASANGISIPMPTMAHPALPLRDTLGTTGKEIERLLGAARLSEEEEKQIAGEVIEFTKRQLALNEALRALHKSEESRQ